MKEKRLRDNDVPDVLEDVWDDQSLWNEDVDSTLPELDHWNDMLKELLPEEEPAPKAPPARPEPVVELRAVEPKVKTPVTPKKPPELRKKRGPGISDKQLLLLIQKYKEADKICEMAHISLQTLQRKVGYLSHRLKRYIDVKGLYRETGPVTLTRDGIKISKGHLVETDFNTGDRFKIGFKDNYIILARLPK